MSPTAAESGASALANGVLHLVAPYSYDPRWTRATAWSAYEDGTVRPNKRGRELSVVMANACKGTPTSLRVVNTGTALTNPAVGRALLESHLDLISLDGVEFRPADLLDAALLRLAVVLVATQRVDAPVTAPAWR